MEVFKVLLGLYGLLLFSFANATSYTVWNTKISVYAQSKAGSTAHLIESQSGIYNSGKHPWCGNRAYIDMGDTELFAAALAASTSKQPVSFMYDDAAPGRTVSGHITTPCKVTSIFSVFGPP